VENLVRASNLTGLVYITSRHRPTDSSDRTHASARVYVRQRPCALAEAGERQKNIDQLYPLIAYLVNIY